VDAAALRQLNKLKTLIITGFGFGSNTIIANAQAIAELKDLGSLTLGGLQLTNLDFLAELQNLTELNLNELPITSIEPVRRLRSLKKISLTSIQVVDISPLADLPTLAEVRIMRTPARSDVVSLLQRRGIQVTVY
jgi:Leucine-rich repeat (LRR) protein